MTKRCSKCKETKDVSEFHLQKSKPDGLRSQCKVCRQRQRELNRDKLNARRRERYWEDEELRKRTQARNKDWQSENKEQVASQRKAYRKENREKVLEGKRIHYQENKTEILRKQSEYASIPEVRSRRRSYVRKYQRDRRSNDTVYRMKDNLRCRLWMVVTTKPKAGSAVRDLGCSAEFLIAHIERQFKEGMTWENRGTFWELDHIYPLNKADITDRVEFLAVNNWRNLQPLSRDENTRKSDKVTPAARKLFRELCEEFSNEEAAA